jgi:hypothetical protein
MRTKTLLFAIALSAVATVSSLAQSTNVFSVNAVGYVNVVVPPGFSLFANPLNSTNNTVASLIPVAPLGTTIYKFDNASSSYSINAMGFGGNWGNPTQTLAPGDGAFIRNGQSTNLTFTFVGEVLQGLQTNQVLSGFSIRSSVWPASGKVSTDLGLPIRVGDVVYTFDTTNQTYVINAVGFGGTFTTEPVISVGQSFFMNKTITTNWVQNFSANN